MDGCILNSRADGVIFKTHIDGVGRDTFGGLGGFDFFLFSWGERRGVWFGFGFLSVQPRYGYFEGAFSVGRHRIGRTPYSFPPQHGRARALSSSRIIDPPRGRTRNLMELFW